MSTKTITAKFSSKCTRCAQVVAEGQRCLWTPGQKGVAHVTCPEQLDVELELSGDTLRARLAEIDALERSLLPVYEDRVWELSGDCTGSTCEACKGKGYTSISADVSDTMDYSDWQTFPVACGRKIELAWEGRGFRVLVDGKPARLVWVGEGFERMGLYAPVDEPAAARNATCLAEQAKVEAHGRRVWEAERTALAEMPALPFLERLRSWIRADLAPRRGDVATVLHRGKARTGRVIWIGEGDERLQIVDDAGAKWGGAMATAQLVSRASRFSRNHTGPKYGDRPGESAYLADEHRAISMRVAWLGARKAAKAAAK